jgi:hypothetical protein
MQQFMIIRVFRQDFGFPSFDGYHLRKGELDSALYQLTIVIEGTHPYVEIEQYKQSKNGQYQ